jgi:hypothetical protein
MHIIIPMSGIGKCFIQAGYNVPKLLIIIENKHAIIGTILFKKGRYFLQGLNEI